MAGNSRDHLRFFSCDRAAKIETTKAEIQQCSPAGHHFVEHPRVAFVDVALHARLIEADQHMRYRFDLTVPHHFPGYFRPPAIAKRQPDKEKS
jgi:hypothetical protein